MYESSQNSDVSHVWLTISVFVDSQLLAKTFNASSRPRLPNTRLYAPCLEYNSDFTVGMKMEIKDLMRLRMISDPQISPDGRKIAFVHTGIDYDSNDYVSDVWLTDLESMKSIQLTSGRGKDTYPRWSPDGSKLLFISSPPKRKDDEKKGQLFVIDVSGGEAKQLTDIKEGVKSPRWCPDGRRILFISPVEEQKSKTDVKVIKRVQYRYNAKGYFDGKRNHLFTILVAGSKPKQVTRGEYDVDAAEWLDKGRTIAFISNLNQDADLTGDKFIYSVQEENEPHQLTDGHRIITNINMSPNGDEIAYVGHDYRKGLATKKDVWVFPTSGGPSQNLTHAFDQDTGNNLSCDTRMVTPDPNPQWSADAERLYFSSVYGGVAGLYRVSRNGSAVEKVLGDIDHGIEAWSVSEDETIAYTVLKTTAPMELWVEKDGKEKQITDLNARWIRSVHVCGQERFTFRSSAGHAVEGWLMRPPDFRKGKKYPMLLEIHGGPRMTYGYGLMHEFQVLASQGWVVVYTNPYGSGGYGEDFQTGLPGHYGEQDYADLMEATDHVLERYDFIDPKRLGVLGGSYGGYMTNWIVTHTDRFKAAVTMRSISNWVSMFGCSDIGWTFGKWEMGGNSPWSDEAAYMVKSPICYVNNAKTPTLIIHSEEDYRCPIEQAEQFFTALMCQGVPTELIRFPGENHDLSREGKPKHREERLNHIIRWFKQYL